MKLKLILVASALLTSACASVNSVSLTPIPQDRRNQVKVEASKTIFLGFNFDNDFIDGMVDDLKTRCPNGKVTGILTKDETINYFLFIVWKKQVSATGYCVTATTAATSKSPKKRGTASDLEQTSDESSL